MGKTNKPDTNHIRINGVQVNIVQELAERGACANSDPDLFFPEGGDYVASIRQAKAICSTCPVASLCLDFAVANDEWGVWGGTTMKERKLLRREKDRDRYIIELRFSGGKADVTRLEDENNILGDED